jgi:hypothetical protein
VRESTAAGSHAQVLTYSLTRKDGGGSTATAPGAVFRATPEAGAVPVNGSCSIGFTCTASAEGDHELLYVLELSDRVTSEKVGSALCALSVAWNRRRVVSRSFELCFPAFRVLLGSLGQRVCEGVCVASSLLNSLHCITMNSMGALGPIPAGRCAWRCRLTSA